MYDLQSEIVELSIEVKKLRRENRRLLNSIRYAKLKLAIAWINEFISKLISRSKQV